MYRILAIALIIVGAALIVPQDAGSTDAVKSFLFDKYEPSAAKDLRYFKSTSELKSFLVTDLTNLEFYREDTNDCDDIARHLQKRAADAGYIMNLQVLNSTEYEKLFGKKISSNHMICSTMIGDSIYFVEPQNDKIVYVMNVD